MKTEDLLQQIVKERPVGTDNNERIISLLKEDFLEAGCKVTLLPFKCLLWRKGDSVLEIGDVQFKVEASTYSRPFSGTGEARVIETLEALHKAPLKDKIIILRNESFSNFFEGALAHTHTPQGTLSDIDKDLIDLTDHYLNI